MKRRAAREDEELPPRKTHTEAAAEKRVRRGGRSKPRRTRRRRTWKRRRRRRTGRVGGERGAQLEESPAKGPRRRWETAFTCSDRPTAEYGRRLVVMETGRQSRLLMGLWRNEAPPPQPHHSSLHTSLHPGQTPSRHRKPFGGNLQVGFLQPKTKTGNGRRRWTRVPFIRWEGGSGSATSQTRAL